MKLALLNLSRVVMSVRRTLPIFLFTHFFISNCFSEKIITKVKYFLHRYTISTIPLKTCSGVVRFMLVSTLLLFAVTLNLLAEGTKQLEPTSPNAANGYCEITLFAGGMTPNGYRIPFATVGCSSVYRLHVHISDPTTEVVYFGFKQKGIQPLFYRWRDPNDQVVPGYTLLASQPTVGTPGYIDTWNEAVAGPIIGALNPGGYDALSFIPSIPGDYYLEFAANAAGSTATWSVNNPPTLEFFDVSVYKGNTVKQGRLWSRAWQFGDVSGNYSPKTNFYIYSNDSVVTKLNVNNWKGGHYIFYCNEWGNENTGNWYTDRQSLNTWPGDLPEYKEFLNDPDNIVYPTGSFGKICDVQTISKCDGSVEFQVKVNKAGKIDMTIDIAPLNNNGNEDVKINADVTGSPGCTTWETINWDGKNGFGQLLANGLTTNVTINYLNGLTHLPVYDIESNSGGIMVDLVRPVPVGDSRLNIFWDDTQVAIAPNPKTNFTGCIYNAPAGCHTWPNGDKVMFNSWWYYLADVANVSPVISRAPVQPSQAPGGTANFCGIQTNVSYTIPAIQFADSYVWSLPNGTVRTTPTNTIVLDTLKPGTGKLSVHGINSYCDGIESPYLVITVKPTPDVSAEPYTQTICSGNEANIILTSDQPNTTYTWTVWSPSSIGGLLAGAKTVAIANTADTVISQSLVNTSNADHPVIYTITPSVNGCTGTPIVIDLTVLARMDLTVTPPSPIPTCSGSNLDIILTSNMSDVTFTWKPILPADSITGASIGGLTTTSDDHIHIMQNLTNTGKLIHLQDYEVTITRNGCVSAKQGFTVTVYPQPVITNSPLKKALCSGTLFNLDLSASVSGSSFTWSRSIVNGISNPAASGTTGTINEILTNTSASDIDVEYKLTPTGPAPLGCPGPTVSYIVTVLALPKIDAGPDLTIKNGVNTSITGDVTGRPGGFTYTWTPGTYIASNPGLDSIKTTNLYANRSFTLKAVDSKGCISSDNMTVFVVGPPLKVSPFATPAVICLGDSSILTAFATGGSENYTYSWSSNPAGFTSVQGVVKVSPAVDTYYTLTVNDGYNVTSTSAQVIVNPLPLKYTLSGGGEYCSGGLGVPVGLTNSQPGISYQLRYNGTAVGIPVSGTGFPINFLNQTAAGTYTVVATNSTTGCTADMGNSKSVVINPLPVANAGADFTIPHGISTTLTGSASGGTSPYNYSWSPLTFLASGSTAFSSHTTNLYTATTFTLVVTDSKGCKQNDQVTVSLSGSALNATATAGSSQICNDGSQVQLFSSATGGSGVYSYKWTSVPAGSPVWTSLQQNPWVVPTTTTMYTVEVNDGYNSFSTSVQVIVNPLPVKYSLSGGGEYCSGGSGVLTGLTNSQSGVNYQLFRNGSPVGSPWPGTGSAISFGNQTLAGTYTVKATRTLTGCSADMSNNVSVSINPLPLVSAGFDFTIPHGTSTSLNGSLTGGASPITYSWSPSANIAVGPVSLTPNTTNLYSATTFTLGATDAKGCSANDQVTVSLSGSALNVTGSASSFQICNDGSQVQLFSSATGGSENYTYKWTSSPAGNPVWSSSQQNPWVTPATTTSYTVIVNDGYNSVTTSVTVIVNPLPTQYNLTGGGEYCFGGTGVLAGLTNSQPGVNYQLFRNGIAVGTQMPGTGFPIDFGYQTLAGTYTVSGMRTTTGCTTTMGNSVVVSINPLPVANAGFDFTIPHGISTTLNGSVSGGTSPYLISWSPSANIASGPTTLSPQTTNLYSASTFTLAIKDAKGCTGNDQVTVSLSGSALKITASASVLQICNNASQVQLFSTASGGSGSYTYSWTKMPSGNPNWSSTQQNPWVSPNTTTMYNVEVNDGYNTATGSVQVVVNPLPAAYSVMGGGTYCSTGNGLPLWLNGSQTNTSYQLLQAGVPAGPVIYGTGTQINFGNYYVSDVYTVVATNLATGCVNTMTGSVNIFVNPLPKIYKMDPIGEQCPGTIIRLNGSESGVNYFLLLDGIPVDSIAGTGVIGFLDYGPRTTSGTYTILAVNMATGCSALMDGSTHINVAPEIYSVLPAGILCPGQIIRLSGSEVGVSYQLRWNTTFDYGSPVPGTGSTLNMGTGNQPGVYTVIGINDITRCVSYMNDSATLYPNPILYTIVPDGEACEGDEISLNGSQAGVDYVLLLDNAIHADTIHGTGSALNFGSQFTEGNYTIIAVIQNSYCITQMNGVAVFRDAPVKFDIVPAGIICIGNSVGLAASQAGISYQLLLNGNIKIGSPVAGTGSSINFGDQTLVGTYTVRAVNDITGCNSMMAGNADLVPLPVVYQVSPSGNHCAGTNITLDGSELNFNYRLVLNGSVNVDTLAGTGSVLDFGPQITAGTYTVVAFSSSTFCLTNMNGSSGIDPRPTLFSLNPAGVACVGDDLGLNNSESGTSYQLRRDGTTNAGTPVAGTGSAISFGIQTIPGTYFVEATGSNGCHAIMTDSVTFHSMPVPFTILPAGIHCPGTVIKLNGSETGVNYVLLRNGIFAVDTLAGTDGILDFGTPMIAGTYTVLAYSTAALCQSAMNGTTVLMASPTAFNITPAGINCIGSTIGLDNSETSVTYQLRRDGITNVGVPVAGNGSAISFGVLNIPGVYTVIATSTLNGCGSTMNGIAVLKPLPLIYTLTLQGKQCAGIPIILNGSQVGTDYVLVRDNTFNIDTISGTGTPIDFGPQFVTGTYSVVAIAGATTCQVQMNNSIQIMALPTVFNITPAGMNCATANVGLDGSEIGITYTLYKNNIVSGSPVSGTGNAINFGIQSQKGIYKVIAVNDISGCNSLMTDSIVLEQLPVLFSTTPAGSHCAGTSIGLNGSEKNINYILVLNGSINLDTIKGTGNAIDFGARITGGNYSIVAFNPSSFCRRLMNSNTIIVADPIGFAMTPAGITCAGSNLGIESSQSGITYQLYWNGGVDIGAPVAGTGSDISFGIQNLPGTYTVKATNSLGCSTTMSSKVEANPLPNVFNLVPSGTQCQGTSLDLDGSEINANYILVHNGNVMIDTISGTGTMISFGPQLSSGNYSVLAFYNSTHCQSGMNGATTIISQSAPAIYSITPAGISCDSTNIGLNDSEIATFYQLRLNGSINVGTPVSGTGSAINFGMQTVKGVYTILCTNSNGCATYAFNDVTLGQSPTADFTYTVGECDSVVNFADLTSGAKIARWIWTFGDGASKTIDAPESPDFIHTYTYPGAYQVTLTTENEAGCRNTITKTILRKPCLAAEFKVSDEVVCQKRKMKFAESSTCQAPISSWTWFFGDGTSARFTNPQPLVEHTYAVSGIYTVKMVAATQMVGGMITDTASSQVAVQPAAKASYKWQDVCVGNTTLFDNQTQDNNTIIKSYAWNFGDPTTLSDTSSARDVQYKYDLNGVYTVKLIVTNTLGCTDTIINKINIFKAPAADFTWNNNCAARPVSFTDQSEAATSDIVTWNWQFSNGDEVLDKSTGQNSSFTFFHVGTYNAEMKVIDKNGCSATINKQVTISPNPVAAFTITENYENVQGQIMLSNGTIGGTNNYWDFGNGSTSYGENPVVSYNEEGHYDIKLLTWNDQKCTDTITLSYDLMYKGLYVPNAFDPGHKNPEVAIFKPKGLNLKTYLIQIYDRWGNQLWQSDKLDDNGSPLEGWDGTYKGVLLQQDVYVWKIMAQYNDEQIWDGTNAGNNTNIPQTTAGTITLIR